MEGGTKAHDSGLPATGPVELVPSQRGGFKARYGGRTFTMDTHKGTRCHWRCDMRGCKSRLTTDIYGSDHMVYKFRAHDEDIHQRATSERKRRRSDATYKQQPAVQIGNFNYILENRNGGLKFWRCVYVSCPGRCRTHDGHLVAGPSEHEYADKQQPEMVQDADGAETDQLHSEGATPQPMSQCYLRQQQEDKQEEPKEKKWNVQQQDEQEEFPVKGVGNTVVKSEPVTQFECYIKSGKASLKSSPAHAVADVFAVTSGSVYDQETCSTRSKHARVAGERAAERSASPHAEETAEPRQLQETTDGFQDAHDVYYVSDSDQDNANEDDRSTVSASSTNKDVDGDEKSNVSVDDDGKDDVDQTLSNVSTKVKGKAAWNNALVATDDEDSDGEYEANEEHAIADHSVSGGTSLNCGRQQAICAEALQMTDEAYDKSEQQLRLSVLRQMSQLLEAETELARLRCRNAAVRGQLLARQLADLETKSASTPTTG